MLLGPNSFPEPERGVTDQNRKLVEKERKQYFEELFGAFPKILAVKEELVPIWPGGGVLEFNAPKLANIRVTVSYGLSNIDMPRTERVISSRETFDGEDLYNEWTTEPLIEPMPHVQGRSGYGYEFICLSRSAGTEGELSSEARLLFTFVKAQLNCTRENFLDRAWDKGARIFSFESSDAPEQHYILAPAWDLVPEAFNLSSGSVSFMMIMKLTKDEVEYVKYAGPNKMLEAFKSSGMLPICDDERSSVI